MKLNHDCVRDVLIALENHLSIGEVIYYEKFATFDETKEYTENDIVYSLVKLREAGYIDSDNGSWDNRPHPLVSGITFEGHCFLDNIRDRKVWNEAKNKAKTIASSTSITILGQVASSYIKSKLGL